MARFRQDIGSVSQSGAEIDDRPSCPENRGKHLINWPEILPLTAIAKSQNEKIKRFQEQQLEQGYKKSKGISI